MTTIQFSIQASGRWIDIPDDLDSDIEEMETVFSDAIEKELGADECDVSVNMYIE